MHIYQLTPSSEEHPHVEHVAHLSSLSGKFLYFPHYDSLIVVEDSSISSEEIYELAKEARINSIPLVSADHHPHGFGKIYDGKVVDWKSSHYGETPKDVRETITQELESFHG